FLSTVSRNSENPNAVSLKGDFEGDFRRFSLIHHLRGNPSAHSLRGVSLNSATIVLTIVFTAGYVEGDYIFSEFSGKKNGYTRTSP
ncbi:unnamed protein product, partial [Brassica oleracea]